MNIRTFLSLIACVLLLAASVTASHAFVVLELRAQADPVTVGQQSVMELWATTTPGSTESIASGQVGFTWDKSYLGAVSQLSCASDWARAGFVSTYGPNTSLSDGDAFWDAEMTNGSTMTIDENGTLLATFAFQTLASTEGSLAVIDMGTVFHDGQYDTNLYGANDEDINPMLLPGTVGIDAVVPEPSSLALLLPTAVGLMLYRRKSRA